jgi:predicted glutamine amidotransferase
MISSMCRLFGFRSVINSQVHSSLLSAENALNYQSQKHPDGWGVAYFQEGIPHLIKSTHSAFQCEIFKKVSAVVASQTVLAHIRKATWGTNATLNSHPFQYGRWVFAHNGNIKNFDLLKNEIKSWISPQLKRYILGDTDSETLFFYFLSEIQKHHSLENPNIDQSHLHQILRDALVKILNLTGPMSIVDSSLVPNNSENHLTFLLSSGPVMLGFHGGLDLYFCTHKNKCPERDSCSSFSPVCERQAKEGESVNHLIFASEKLSGVNVWSKLNPFEMISVGQDMKVVKTC